MSAGLYLGARHLRAGLGQTLRKGARRAALAAGLAFSQAAKAVRDASGAGRAAAALRGRERLAPALDPTRGGHAAGGLRGGGTARTERAAPRTGRASAALGRLAAFAAALGRGKTEGCVSRGLRLPHGGVTDEAAARPRSAAGGLSAGAASTACFGAAGPERAAEGFCGRAAAEGESGAAHALAHGAALRSGAAAVPEARSFRLTIGQTVDALYIAERGDCAALRTRLFAACAQSDPASELLLRLGRADGARWEFTARAYDAACPAENAAAGSFRIAGQFIRADGTAGSGLTIPVGADGSYRLGGGMSGALNVLVMRELREGGGSATVTALSPDGLRLFATDPAQFAE